MIRYIDAGTTRQHLTDRLMESALNNVGIKADADEVFRDIAENRLPVWIDELQTYDVQKVKHGVWLSHPSAREYDVCSACGCGVKRREYGVTDGRAWMEELSYHFCPWCGAKLEGSEE